MLKLIHYNSNRPQYHNIYYQDEKDVCIYDGKVFKNIEIKDALKIFLINTKKVIKKLCKSKMFSMDVKKKFNSMIEYVDKMYEKENKREMQIGAVKIIKSNKNISIPIKNMLINSGIKYIKKQKYSLSCSRNEEMEYLRGDEEYSNE